LAKFERALLPASNRRAVLEDWLDNEIIPWFAGRVLPVTLAIAEHWGYPRAIEGKRPATPFRRYRSRGHRSQTRLDSRDTQPQRLPRLQHYDTQSVGSHMNEHGVQYSD
jgi:hypothetical protein